MNTWGRPKKAVRCLDLKTGEEIRKFESISEASRACENPYARFYITNNCLGKTKSALGYKWEFINE